MWSTLTLKRQTFKSLGFIVIPLIVLFLIARLRDFIVLSFEQRNIFSYCPMWPSQIDMQRIFEEQKNQKHFNDKWMACLLFESAPEFRAKRIWRHVCWSWKIIRFHWAEISLSIYSTPVWFTVALNYFTHLEQFEMFTHKGIRTSQFKLDDIVFGRR